MVNEIDRGSYFKAIGITAIFFSLIYLVTIKKELLTSDVELLRTLAIYLPMRKRLLLYWFLLASYALVEKVRGNTVGGFKAGVWAYFIAIGTSWLFAIAYDGVPLENILLYLKGFKHQSNGAFIWGVLVMIISFMVSFIAVGRWKRFLHDDEPSNEVLVRGKSFLSLDRAREISRMKVANDSPGVEFGWITVPESQATTHFAVVGATGGGKTLLIRFLMQSTLPRIKKGSDSRALIYDPKRDMLPILHGLKLDCEIVTLHPFDKRCAAWDMAKDILSPASADQMATILIPAEKNSSSPFFTDAARALMAGVITVFIKKCPEEWTFRDLILTLKNTERLKTVLLSCEETKDLVEQYFSNERTANDVVSTIATKIQRYQYVAAAWDKAERKISLKDWANSEFVLVLGNDEETRSAVDALNQVIFKRVSELLLNQTESFTRRSWVILDELREAGTLPGLPSILSKGRSKGVCVVLGFQDIEGLGVAMRDNRLANEIVGLCSNKAILRLDSAETARWASAQFGDQEVEQKKITSSDGKSSNDYKFGGSTSSSTSETWANLKKQAVMPVQFLDLPPVEKSGALHGFYIVPSIGTYRANIRMSGEHSILSDLIPTDPNTPGYLERSKDDQFLRPWDDTDLKRLKLSPAQSRSIIEIQQTQKEQEELPKIGSNLDPLELIKR